MKGGESSVDPVKHKRPKFLLEESVICDNSIYKLELYDDCIEFKDSSKDDSAAEKISWDDILMLTDTPNVQTEGSFTLHYIKDFGRVDPKKKGIRWKHLVKEIQAEQGRDHNILKLRDNMQELIDQKIFGRPKSLLILVNPKSGSGNGNEIYTKTVAPLMELVKVKVDKIVMEGVEQTRKILNDYDLNTIDGIVVLGGDGSMADVINTMVLRHQREAGIDVNDVDVEIKPIPITLGIIPAGTGQGDTLILNGSFEAETATLHIIKGVVTKGDLHSCHNGNRWVYSGILGGGVGYCGDLLVYSERKRWLGTWRYLVSFIQAMWYLTTFNAELEVLTTSEDGTEEWEKKSGKFVEIGVSPGRMGIGKFFPGILEVLAQEEASRGDTMKYIGKLVNCDTNLVKLFVTVK